MEVNSIEEFVGAGVKDLQSLAQAGNPIAEHWVQRIQNQPTAAMKLNEFGEMRIALMNDGNTEAKEVYSTMFPAS